MRRLFALMLVLCSLVAMSLANLARPQKPIIPQPTNVSMIQLIATPEKFDGKIVSVVGYLGIESEDARLYLSEEDYRRYIPGNGVWVDANKETARNVKQIDMHYVVLVGVFKQKGLPLHFPGGAGDAGITDIRLCHPWLEPTDKRPRQLKESQPEKPR